MLSYPPKPFGDLGHPSTRPRCRSDSHRDRIPMAWNRNTKCAGDDSVRLELTEHQNTLRLEDAASTAVGANSFHVVDFFRDGRHCRAPYRPAKRRAKKVINACLSRPMRHDSVDYLPVDLQQNIWRQSSVLKKPNRSLPASRVQRCLGIPVAAGVQMLSRCSD